MCFCRVNEKMWAKACTVFDKTMEHYESFEDVVFKPLETVLGTEMDRPARAIFTMAPPMLLSTLACMSHWTEVPPSLKLWPTLGLGVCGGVLLGFGFMSAASLRNRMVEAGLPKAHASMAIKESFLQPGLLLVTMLSSSFPGTELCGYLAALLVGTFVVLGWTVMLHLSVPNHIQRHRTDVALKAAAKAKKEQEDAKAKAKKEQEDAEVQRVAALEESNVELQQQLNEMVRKYTLQNEELSELLFEESECDTCEALREENTELTQKLGEKTQQHAETAQRFHDYYDKVIKSRDSRHEAQLRQLSGAESLAVADREMYFKQNEELKAILNSTMIGKQNLSGELERVKSRNEQLESLVKELQTRVPQAIMNFRAEKEEHQKSMAAFADELEQANARAEGIESRRRNLYERCEALQSEKEEAVARAEGMELRRQIVYERCETLQNDLEEAEARAEGIESRTKHLYERCEALQDEKEKAIARAEGIESRRKVVYERCEALQNEKERAYTTAEGIESRRKIVYERCETLQSENEQLQTKVQAHEEDKKKYRELNHMLLRANERLQTRNWGLGDDIDKYGNKVNELKGQVERLQARNRRLEDEKDGWSDLAEAAEDSGSEEVLTDF